MRKSFPSLDLETARPSATTSLLELAALGGDVRLLVLVGTEAEMLDSLAGVLGATEEEGVGTGGLLESELIESDGLAASGDDAGTGGGGEAQSGDGHLGDDQETVVIGDGTNNNDGLLLVAVLEVLGNAGQRDRRAVDAAHEQAAKHDLVEGRVSAAWWVKWWLAKCPILYCGETRERSKTYGPRSGKA